MKKKIIVASAEERAKMDSTDKMQQEMIEHLSARIESLIWTLIMLTVVASCSFVFYWAYK